VQKSEQKSDSLPCNGNFIYKCFRSTEQKVFFKVDICNKVVRKNYFTALFKVIFYMVSTKFLSCFDMEHSNFDVWEKKILVLFNFKPFFVDKPFFNRLSNCNWLLRNKSVKSKRNETCLFQSIKDVVHERMSLPSFVFKARVQCMVETRNSEHADSLRQRLLQQYAEDLFWDN